MVSDKIFGIKEYSQDEFGRTLDVAFVIEKTVYPETVKTAYRDLCRRATEPLVDGTPIVILKEKPTQLRREYELKRTST